MKMTTLAHRLLYITVYLLLAVVAAKLTAEDKDTHLDCLECVHTCRSDPLTWYDCPVTCSAALRPIKPMVQGRAPNRDTFFYIKARKADGEMMNFEQFDGSITFIAAIPLLPGMSSFYHEFTERLVALEPFRMSCIILPFQSTKGDTDPNVVLDTLQSSPHNNQLPPRCQILKTWESDELGNHPLVRYVENVRKNSNIPDVVSNDLVTIFLVNHDGALIERRVVPTIEHMANVANHYLNIMDREI